MEQWRPIGLLSSGNSPSLPRCTAPRPNSSRRNPSSSEVAASSLLFREGEPGSSFAFIVDGQVEIHQGVGHPRRAPVRRVRGPGDFFGEMSLLDPDGLRTASVAARTPVRLLEMARPDFDTVLQHRPAWPTRWSVCLACASRIGQHHHRRPARKNRELARPMRTCRPRRRRSSKRKNSSRNSGRHTVSSQSILPSELPRLPGYDFARSSCRPEALGATSTISYLSARAG